MKLEDWRKKDVLDSVDTLEFVANEATRSHKVIGILLSHIIKQDRSYNFICENVENGLITDFELTKDNTLIHIIEAKQSAAKKAEEQLKKYLEDRKCTLGCITDGLVWQFYKLEDRLSMYGKPIYTEHNLEDIVTRITEGY